MSVNAERHLHKSTCPVILPACNCELPLEQRRLVRSVLRDPAAGLAAAQDKERARFAAAVEAAFDQGELDCGRLGLPCTAANSSDRWCRACRIRAILDLPVGAA